MVRRDVIQSFRKMKSRDLLGKNIRRIRGALRQTQEDLAAEIRKQNLDQTWDQAYVSRLERGQVNATLDSVDRIADALKVEVRELFRADPFEEGHQ